MTRLADMGVEPFLLSSSLVGTLSQRLIRVLCPACRRPAKADLVECEFLNLDPNSAPTVYHPEGCDECGHTGFRGRTGIYEIVNVDEGMRELIHERASEQAMTRYARQSSPGIREDGRQKVLAGTTSVQEVLRVTLEE